MEAAKTVQLVSFDRAGRLVLDQKALRSLFLRDDVRDRQVAIVSVAGAFRQGKSFLMDFLIDFLKTKGAVRWLDKGDAKIEGFEWRSSRKRVTQGINVWSQYFLVKDVAVFLMDTQGTMDTQSSKDESTIVFALSALLSSTQIYNVMDIMGSQDLFNVEYFAEYGRLALQDAGQGARPFQKFLFLVRDWKHTEDHPFGVRGGREYLDSFVKSDNAKKRKMYESVHSTLNLCFSDTLCFLMPYPGEHVDCADSGFKGELKDVSPEFLQQVAELARLLLSPEGLPPKKVCGRTVTAKELVPFFTKHAEIFNSGKLPKPKSLLDVLAFDVLRRLVERCKGLYDSQMKAGLAVQGADLTRVHEGAVRVALEEFSRASKVGSETDVEEHRQQLQNYMSEQLEFHEEMSSVREELAAKKAELERQAQIQREIQAQISQLKEEGSKIAQECQEATKAKKTLERKVQETKREEDGKKMELRLKEAALLTKEENARSLARQLEEKKRSVQQRKEKIENLKKMIEEKNAKGFLAGLKDLGMGYAEAVEEVLVSYELVNKKVSKDLGIGYAEAVDEVLVSYELVNKKVSK